MVSVLILGFLGALIGGNGIPHFVKGITGQRHRTPFGNPSSPLVNVFWGWLNFVVAILIWHIVPLRHHPRAAFLAVMLGLLVIGVILAQSSLRRPSGSKESSK